jgi:isopentenyl-diphosphate delta-isomerase
LIAEAASRRLQDELHTDCTLEFIYKFVYQVPFGDLGSEHELCHVFLGRVGGSPSANETEVAAVRSVPAGTLEKEFEERPEDFTPWFRLEWARLTGEYAETLANYTCKS